MSAFDPNSASAPGAGIFGLPHKEKDAALVFLPVPWEATTSYGGGTSKGPAAILKASAQVDLFDFDVLRPYEAGLFLLPEPKAVKAWNAKARAAAKKVIAAGGEVGGRKDLRRALAAANDLGAELNDWVYAEASRLMDAGKVVGLVGGDHSTPYGAMRAAAERTPGLGVLHFDAHHDMRAAYEGLQWSHASIMFNVLEDLPQVARMVQVGIRDFCEEEADYVRSQGPRVKVFYDGELCRRKFDGEPWGKLCTEIAASLPQTVWVTFDVDGLDPAFCPHTGTPVPGGLSFSEAAAVLAAVVRSGRTIAGFDLNEVAPDPSGKSEWDANVGARLLYKLSAWTLASRGLAKLR